MLRLATTVAAALLAAGTVPAGAQQPVVPVVKAHPATMAFNGDRLVWGDDDQVRARTPDGRIATLHRAKGSWENSIDYVTASPTRVAFLSSGQSEGGEGGGETEWYSLRAGPTAGPFPLIAGRERPFTQLGPQDVAVADNGLLVVDRGRRGFTIQWRPDGGTPVALRRFEDNGWTLAAAGTWAAIGQLDDVDVYDLASGTPVLAYSFPARGLPKVAVDRDGAVVALDADHRLLHATPAAPAPVQVAQDIPRISGFGAGTVVYSVDRGYNLAQVRALHIASAATREASPWLPSDFMFAVSDGAHLAYTTGTCIYAGDLPAAAPESMPVGPGCGRPPLHLAADEVTSTRAISVTLSCPGGPADRCAGELRLQHRRRIFTRLPFDLHGGDVFDTTLRVRAAQLRTVKRDRVFKRSRFLRLRTVMAPDGGRVDYADLLIMFR